MGHTKCISMQALFSLAMQTKSQITWAGEVTSCVTHLTTIVLKKISNNLILFQ